MDPGHIGKYTIIRKIASGGMAEVFLCRLTGIEGFEKNVAVKVIHPRLSEEERFRDLFIREARIAASLSHQNLVQVFDFGRVENSFYLAMEYIDGMNLAQVIAQARMRSAKIPLGVWRYWMEGMLSGLGYLHSRGIVHRDISPSNVLVSRGGVVKITDFGIARSSRQDVKKESAWEGKIRYMSPEQARGEEADARSDLFAAAVVSTELFLSERLNEKEKPKEILSQLRKFDPDSLNLRAMPSMVYEAVRKCLSENREDRYASAEDFLRIVCTAVPAPAGRIELCEFWDALFPGAVPVEEETVVDNVHSHGANRAFIREAGGKYGGKEKNKTRIGAISVFVTFSAGIVVAWTGFNVWKERDTHTVASPSAVRFNRDSIGSDLPLQVSSTGSPPFSSVRKEPGGDHKERPVPLLPAAPSVSRKSVLIETEPAGVSLSLEDGTPLGKTPLSIDLAPWVGKKIVFQQDGYVGKSVSAEVLAQLQAFRMQMEREMGTIEVIQAIPWAKVFDGDRYLGETPISVVKIPVGEHRFRVVNEPLGVEKILTVNVHPGKNPKLIVPLVDK